MQQVKNAVWRACAQELPRELSVTPEAGAGIMQDRRYEKLTVGRDTAQNTLVDCRVSPARASDLKDQATS